MTTLAIILLSNQNQGKREKEVRIMRISRPCYDKPHRCPGWAGGGTRYAKVQRCAGITGSMVDMYEKRFWQFRFNKHNECGVTVLPYAVRWLDWRYVWGWKILDFWKR